MREVRLRDGSEGRIEVWDDGKLDMYLKTTEIPWVGDIDGPVRFEGFRFLGPYTAEDKVNLIEYPSYSAEEDLTPLEIQEEGLFPNRDYHRNLVFIRGGEFAGLYRFQWLKEGKNDFWRYCPCFIDVGVEHRRKGIATDLVKALNEAEFLKGHILQVGEFVDDGVKFVRPLWERFMTAEDYALIPRDYCGETPTQPGMYNFRGDRIESVADLGRIETFQPE